MPLYRLNQKTIQARHLNACAIPLAYTRALTRMYSLLLTSIVHNEQVFHLDLRNKIN
jgi:hypothetical protein